MPQPASRTTAGKVVVEALNAEGAGTVGLMKKLNGGWQCIPGSLVKDYKFNGIFLVKTKMIILVIYNQQFQGTITVLQWSSTYRGIVMPSYIMLLLETWQQSLPRGWFATGKHVLWRVTHFQDHGKAGERFSTYHDHRMIL